VIQGQKNLEKSIKLNRPQEPHGEIPNPRLPDPVQTIGSITPFRATKKPIRQAATLTRRALD
jgi:hypothetical protein